MVESGGGAAEPGGPAVSGAAGIGSVGVMLNPSQGAGKPVGYLGRWMQGTPGNGTVLS